MKSIRPITRAGLIAALYVLLTALSAAFGLSSGAVQFRLSEGLCLLPLFFPEAVWGLFGGCLLANLLFGGTIWDILCGALATCFAAALTYRMRNVRPVWLCAIPPVLCNAAVVPCILFLSAGSPFSLPIFIGAAATVALGETVCAGGLGTALILFLQKNEHFWRK